MRQAVQPAADRENLAGLVERVTFHNEESGFCVLRVKVRGQRDLITVVGHAAAIGAGEFVQASGRWVNDRTHGVQFRADFLRAAPPTTAEGIEKYLASGMIKGIGPIYAKKLVEAFGEQVFDVIEQTPATAAGGRRHRPEAGREHRRRLGGSEGDPRDHGLPARPRRRHVAGGAHLQDLRRRRHPRRSPRTRTGWRATSAASASRAPIRSPAKLGIEKTAMIRARAGIGYALTEAMDEGHCGLPREQLLHDGRELLEMPAAIIEDGARAGAAGRRGGRRHRRRRALHLPRRAASGRAGHRRSRANARVRPLPWPAIDAEKAIPWVEGKAGVTLADSQREAVRLALRSKVLVITGGPGVGKTTLVNAILKILSVKGVQRRAGRADRPGGEAAVGEHRPRGEDDPSAARGRSRTRRLPAQGGSPARVRPARGRRDVDGRRAADARAPEGGADRAALILVGDVDQLPSVGPGQVLADIIGSGAVPVVRLTEIFRQAAESRIIVNAHRINRGLMPEWVQDPASDFYFIECADAEDGAAKILQIVRERIPARFGLDPIRDIQVLCPMNRGGLGARSLNIDLQQALNPPGELRVERFGSTFGVGDKVMQIENDYDKDVYNGDLGVVRAIDPEASEMVIDFDGRPVTYDFGELDELVLAYATTIHKTPGLRVPGRRHPADHPALPDAAAEPALHRRHARQAAGRPRRPEEGDGDRGEGEADRRRWSKLKEHLSVYAARAAFQNGPRIAGRS